MGLVELQQRLQTSFNGAINIMNKKELTKRNKIQNEITKSNNNKGVKQVAKDNM